MSPDPRYDPVVFVVGCIGILEVFVVMLFWYLHLSQHRTHPIYRIRQPIFWTVTMVVFALQPIWRAITVYLFTHSFIHRDIYSSLETFRIFILSLGFTFLRAFFLWYSYKQQRCERSTLITRHLLTEQILSHPVDFNDSMFNLPKLSQQTAPKPPFLYRHSNLFGSAAKMTVFVLSMLTIFWIICTTLALTVHSWNLIRLLWMLALVPYFLMISVFLCTIWCRQCSQKTAQHHHHKHHGHSSQVPTVDLTDRSRASDNPEKVLSEIASNGNNDPEIDDYDERHIDNDDRRDADTMFAFGGSFRDDFRFRLELTLYFLTLVAFTMFQLFSYNRYPIEQDNVDWQFGLLLSLIGNLLSSTLGIFIQTAIPYYTFQRNMAIFGDGHKGPKLVLQRNHSSEQTTSSSHHVVSLLDVLTHKYAFFNFLNHLVQELSFENMAFLIDVFQFKCISHNVSAKSLFSKKQFKTTSALKGKARKKNKRKTRRLKRNTSEPVPTTVHTQLKLQISHSNTGHGHSVPPLMKLSVPPLPLQTTESNSKSYISELSQPSVYLATNDSNKSELQTKDSLHTTNAMESVDEEDHEYDSFSSESNDTFYSEYSRRKGTVDIAYFCKVLCNMPWHGIPLTNVYDADKLQQATNIFEKYIVRDSYYSVNISSESWVLIDGLMNRLRKYGHRNEANSNQEQLEEEEEDEDDEKEEKVREFTPPSPPLAEEAGIEVNYVDDNDEVNIPKKLLEADNIESKQQFDAILMSIFDYALPDIFANLEDSMSRFRITDEFLQLTGRQ